MQNKWQSYNVWFLRYQAQHTELFVIFDNFLPFYLPNNPKIGFEKLKKMPGGIIILCMCNKWQSYDIWFLRYWVWCTEFFVILEYFLSFYPPNNSKNQNFEKMKITPGDIIILHMCTINDNHMMFGSLYLDVRDGQKFLSFWTIFCPFTPVKTWKIKIFEKWKNRLEISSFYTNVTKMIIICYIVPEIRCKMGCKAILIFYFGLFYGLLPPPP